MGNLIISGLDTTLRRKLRLRAKRNGRSEEDEAHEILRMALCDGFSPPGNLADAIRARVEPLGGIALSLPEREAGREPPKFE